MNRKLIPAERHYAAVEQETLAIKLGYQRAIKSVKRYYLTGCHFTLVTDNALLQWMAKAKDSNSHITHWFLSLQDFLFQVQH